MQYVLWGGGTTILTAIGMVMGAILHAQLIPSEIVEIPVVTERVVETIEKPTIQIIEVPSLPAQTTVVAANGPNLLLPEDGEIPISRWVDPQNLNIIYAVPDGYNAIVIPMRASVPTEWFNLIINDYAMNHPTGLSSEFIDWMPRDWMKVILPGELKYRLTENTDTLLPTNSTVLAP
jgi:hypothetical protein